MTGEPDFRSRLGKGFDTRAGSQLLAERIDTGCDTAAQHRSIFAGVYLRLTAAFLLGVIALLTVVGWAA